MRPQLIERAIDIVVAQCQPERIYVVGSQATGTARRKSDLDLLIVQESTQDKPTRERRVELLLAPLMVPVDVHVYTPDELDDERSQRFGFARTAPEVGVLVYHREPGAPASGAQRWRFVDASREARS